MIINCITPIPIPGTPVSANDIQVHRSARNENLPIRVCGIRGIFSGGDIVLVPRFPFPLFFGQLFLFRFRTAVGAKNIGAGTDGKPDLRILFPPKAGHDFQQAFPFNLFAVDRCNPISETQSRFPCRRTVNRGKPKFTARLIEGHVPDSDSGKNPLDLVLEIVLFFRRNVTCIRVIGGSR